MKPTLVRLALGLLAAGPAAAAPCAPGSFSATGDEPCTLVPPGYYQPFSGRTDYYAASPGMYVPFAGATGPTLSPAGYFVPGSAAASAIAASPGSYVPFVGASSPTLAPPGYYVPGSASTSAIAASPGSYVPFAGASSPTLAPLGYYVPGSAATAAIAASPGSYVPFVGASSPTLAPPGYYQPFSAATTVLAAPPGSYVPSAGATSPTLAPPGTYQPFSAATSVFAASPGSFVANAGATAPTPAPAGTYVASSGATGAVACPGGTNAYGGSSACRIVSANFAAGGPGVGPSFASGLGTGGAHDLGTIATGDRLPFIVYNATTDHAIGDGLTTLSLLGAEVAGQDAASFSLLGFTPGVRLEAGDPMLQFLMVAGEGLPYGAFSFTLSLLTDQSADLGAAGQRFDFAFTGFNETAAVDEPSAAALMLPGLLVAAWARRRGLCRRAHGARTPPRG